MTKSLFVSVFFLLFYLNIIAQSKITGKVVTKSASVLENASVVLIKNNHEILEFTITNKNGFFEIIYDGLEDSIVIKVSIIGYESTSQIIINKTQSLNYILTEQTTELPTVIIRELPISQNGDTTNYLVKNFTGIQDRSIGDVIAKLPGVEIDENTGQIKFNGKPISHYYIDGLDLLEGKYNIANKNIPADLVDQVQLLANEKDIKLFDSLKTSTEPSLNIKLKKKAKNQLIAKAKAGLGLVPLLWDNELTTLRFNSSFQLITSYKNNNAGNLLANELSDNVSIKKLANRLTPSLCNLI